MNRRISRVATSFLVVLSLAATNGIAPSVVFAVAGQAAPSAGGTVFSFGRNISGETGLGTNEGITLVAAPIDTTNLIGRSITQVAAGTVHSLLLADDGTVYSFGWNGSGATGLGTYEGYTLVATPIDTTNLGGRTIRQVAAGNTHSLLLADDVTVFSFGSNLGGQTGLGTEDGSTPIATAIDRTNLRGRTITQVAAGTGASLSGAHSLLLTDDGTVFSFGNNSLGRTGLGTSSGNMLVAMPIDRTNLSGHSITQVAAGVRHSLLLADDGTVFSFGSNTVGQLGLGSDSGTMPIATPIDRTNLSGRSIMQVAAGGSHSLILADDGSVFSFGTNGFGVTGLGTDSGNSFLATLIDATNLGGRSITQVAAGSGHSLLLADDGTVFSFGGNHSGRTGLGTDSGITLVATPIDTSNLVGLRAVGISAGNLHSLLVVVPEPGSITLLLFGTALLWLRRRE